MKLAALRLFVRDAASARDFYACTLGLRLAVDGAADNFAPAQLPA